jgi:hypothetical protein
MMCTCATHCTLSTYHDAACCNNGACTCTCHGDIKLFLDDERETPEGWLRVYTIEQAFFWLRSRRVTHLSLDNDLGKLDPTTEGFNVLDRMEEWVYYDPTFPIPIITIHSSNAARATSMRQTAAKLEAIRQQGS